MKQICKIFLVLYLSTQAFFALSAQIDPSLSTIKVSFKQMGVAVIGQFKQFSGSIDYSPANASDLSKTKADIKVETASFDLGDASYNAEVRKKVWFDSQRFPSASFQLTSVQPNPNKPGEFKAVGKLTIKGVERESLIPVKIITQPNQHIFEGKTTIKRLAFKIGEEEWQDTSIVADDVVIDFRFVTPVRRP